MNNMATKLRLKNTKYASPHGCTTGLQNTSTATEQATLSSHAMKIPILREIVKIKTHRTMTYLPLKKVESWYR